MRPCAHADGIRYGQKIELLDLERLAISFKNDGHGGAAGTRDGIAFPYRVSLLVLCVNVFRDKVRDRRTGSHEFKNGPIRIANEDCLGAAELPAPGDGNAVFRDERLGRLRICHFDGKMGDAGIPGLVIHEDIVPGPGGGRSQKVDVDAGGMEHHQRVPLVIAAVGDEVEAEKLVKGDRCLAVADAYSNVVEVRDIEHVMCLSIRLNPRYACNVNVTRSEKITSTGHFDHMPSIDRMREFLAVADTGSISEAARTLGIPRETLSRRMASLESDLRVRLIIRRTTRLALTHAGEELHRRAQRIIADSDAAWHAVRRLDDTPRGLLRVSVTGPHFLDLFIRYLRDFSEVRIEVQSTPRHVDLLAEGVDVALRIGPVRDKDLIARHLHTDRLIVVASPDYLDRVGRPKSPRELARNDCIVGVFGDWTPNAKWPLRKGGSVTVSGRLSANDIELVRQAALDGLGFALVATAVVAEDIRSGRLEAVLTGEVGTDLPVSLVYADREFIDPKVREFVDRAAKAIARDMPKPMRSEELH